jgi:tRNA A-37 threonylcarbamoyl transferase component Bud32
MKYVEKVLNDKYSELESYVNAMPVSFDGIDEILKNNRNDIRVAHVGGHKLVIKSFKGMYFLNRMVYSLFRKSKARRSYEVSWELQKRGFNVPDPVAFVDCYHWFFLTQSYFISLYQEHKTFAEVLGSDTGKEEMLNRFAQFTFNLHAAGIRHDDYSNGNVLCSLDGNHDIDFSLVDLNRVVFRNVSYSDGIRNLSKLHFSMEELSRLIRRYAELSGRSMSDEVSRIQKLKANRRIFSSWRKWAKSVFYPSRLQKNARV